MSKRESNTFLNYRSVANAKTNGDVDALRKLNAKKASETKRKKNDGKVFSDENKEKFVAAGSSREAKERAAETCLERYGVDNPFKSETFQRKARETRLRRYGDEHYSNHDKARRTCLERYGYKVPHGLTPKYRFEGLDFDSSWELYYFLWLRDTGVAFEYKPKGIKYLIDDKAHYYYPDFYTDHYVDVKGDHLYRDGWLTSPSGKEVFREKTECYRDHDVEVITSVGMRTAFDYVDAKFGKGYVDQFRVRKDV